MNWLRQCFFRLRALFGRKRIEAELTDEIRIHLEMASEAKMACGMSPEEARLAARREFGGVEQIKESYRDERVMVWMDQLAGDIRHSFRSLRRSRGFTATVLLIVAVCVAANVVIFTMVDNALLRPLPFAGAARLVTVHNNYPKAGLLGLGVSIPHYLERRDIPAFAEAGATRQDYPAVTIDGVTERFGASVVTPSFFRVLRIDAVLGRTFTDEEGSEGKDKVVVLSDGFWREHFNGDPAAIGRALRIRDTAYTIVGVMPASYRYLSDSSKLWMPLSFTAEDRKEMRRHEDGLDMIARLRDGATLADAQSQLDAVNARARKLDPMAEMVRSVGYFSNVADLHADHEANIRPVLILFQAGVLFLLLIGTVNLANLFMVRATSRAREYSLRQALGAGRSQLIRALLVEALLLSLAGGLVGIGIGIAALTTWARLAIEKLPMDVELSLKPDATVCVVALGISAALGLLLALPVIWLTMRKSLTASLTVESRGGTTTRSVHRLRHTLIVAQIALAFVLLSGTGFLGLSLIRLIEVNPGFQRDNVITGVVELPWWNEYKEPDKRMALIARMLSSLRAIPGQSAAAISSGVPFTWGVNVEAWSIAGSSAASDEFIKEGLYGNLIAGDYFAAFGIPLREGRLLNDDDVQLKRMVCVVDEEFAHRHWPKGDAIGHQLVEPHAPDDPKPQIYTIVGVVGSIKQHDLSDQKAHGAGYFPAQDLFGFMVTLRTTQATEAAISAIRAVVLHTDPSLVIYDTRPMASRIDDSLSSRKTQVTLAGVFAGASLMLAAVGLYGVLAYSVAQRQREIGVRMALGARPSQILRQFLGLGVRLLCIGLPIGALGAWMAGRAIAGMLFGVRPVDPIVMACTAAVLAAAALPACLLPSNRAAHVAPTEALRAD